MGHHHVLVGAGLLVESQALAQSQRLRDVDLHMIDEIAIPDGFEQAVGEAERQYVLRRLLAEKMIDAEYLLLREYLVQAVVQCDGSLEIGAEWLLHDDA